MRSSSFSNLDHIVNASLRVMGRIEWTHDQMTGQKIMLAATNALFELLLATRPSSES